MKFLAWDVGVKNLAYSIIDFDTEKHTKEILEWGIINLMTEVDEEKKEDTSIICCESNSKGKKCEAKAIFLFQSDENKGICRKHRSTNKYKHDVFFDLTQKNVCCYEINNKKENTVTECGKNSTFARKDELTKTYCNQHLKILLAKEPFEIYEIKKEKKEMVRAQSILTLARRLYQHLDKLKDILLNVDEVMIENQPVLKNPTMKTIQILLYGYFIMNGILKEKINDIHFFSASKKLEAYDDVDNKIAKTVSHLNGQYQINKKLAILYTTEMIKNNKTWFEFFNSHHKKDDLADAYLTNCFYIDRKFKINKFKPLSKEEKKQKTIKKVEDKKDSESKGTMDRLQSLLNDTNQDDEFNFGDDSLKSKNKILDNDSDEDEIAQPVYNNKSTNFRQFYKYGKKNTGSSSNTSKTKVTPNVSSIQDMAKLVPKKKVISGLDKFF
jgi:hypothetical protein